MYRKNYWNLDEKTEETSPCIILKQFALAAAESTKQADLQAG
jgi:hypothetical protein